MDRDVTFDHQGFPPMTSRGAVATHPSNWPWWYPLLTTVLPSAVLPVASAILFDLYLDSERWANEPLHSLVEGVGSFSAIVLALFILIMRRSEQLRPGYIWVATTLMGMGLLDGFHAGIQPGPAFVWLHSVATLMGGLTFALVVLPEHLSAAPRLRIAPYLMAAVSVALGIGSILRPDLIPAMTRDGAFTPIAEWLNLLGGAGFIVAWVHFAWGGGGEEQPERLLLANHCLLFGMAGLLFHFSALWDATWWLWHGVRLMAYLVILWFFLNIYHSNVIRLRESERALRIAIARAEASDRAKSQFLANMSHELRTPMHVILSFAELGRGKASNAKPEQLERYFENIHTSGERLLRLLNDLLDLSKLEAGRMELRLQPQRLDRLAREMIEEIAPLAEEKGIQLELVEGSTREAHCDAERMLQVLRNLVGNAIKFSPERHPIRIVIGDITPTQGEPSRGDTALELRVEDEGIGIPPKELEQVFDKFTQSSKTLSGSGGTGLGLAICKEIVEGHHGTIRAENNPRGGATFIVVLPTESSPRAHPA